MLDGIRFDSSVPQNGDGFEDIQNHPRKVGAQQSLFEKVSAEALLASAHLTSRCPSLFEGGEGAYFFQYEGRGTPKSD